MIFFRNVGRCCGSQWEGELKFKTGVDEDYGF